MPHTASTMQSMDVKMANVIPKSLGYTASSLTDLATLQAKKLMYGLVMASSRNERLSVLKIALVAFDHKVTSVHNDLCLSGGMMILFGCLQRATLDTLDPKKNRWKEIDSICKLLRMANRCSARHAKRAFSSMGTELFLLLFSILIHYQEAGSSGGQQKPNSVHRLIRRLATIEVSLVHMHNSNKLISFLQQIIVQAQGEEKLFAIASNAAFVLAGLTTHEESNLYAMQLPGFMETVVMVAQHAGKYDVEMQHHMAKILRNLAWNQQNKFFMMKKSANVKAVLQLSKSHQDTCTRLEAIKIFRHLSVEAQNKSSLTKYGKGKVLQSLLNAAGKSGCIPELQELSIETLVNLVCHETASTIGSHPGLIQTLESIASNIQTSDCKYKATAASVKAAQTIKRLATHISIREGCHPALLSAVMTLSTSKDDRVRCWASKAFAEQSKLAGSSFFLVRTPEALRELTNLARDASVEVKAAALEGLLNLTASRSNVKRLSVDPDLVDVLVENINSEPPENCSTAGSAAGRNAVQALLILATAESAKKRLAKRLGVVASLSKYGVSQDSDNELKQAALRSVMLLAPLM